MDQIRIELADRLSLADGELREVRLIPWGTIESKNGAFIVDDQASAAIVAGFQTHGVSLPIDVDHESALDAIPPSQKIGAVGWIDSISARSGEGIFGMVRWLDKGRELIKSGAFPYLSPIVLVGKEDRRVMSIHSAALVTLPAIPRMERLAAKQGFNMEKEIIMDDPKKGATVESEDTLIAHTVREVLGLPGNANKDAVLLALSMRAELKDIRQRDEDRQCDERVEKFVRANKLNPNDKLAMEACRQLARSQPDVLEAIFCNMMPYVAPGRTTPPTEESMKSIGRDKAIREAKREIQTYPQLNKLTSLPAYVNQHLRDGGFALLSKEEIEKLTA